LTARAQRIDAAPNASGSSRTPDQARFVPDLGTAGFHVPGGAARLHLDSTLTGEFDDDSVVDIESVQQAIDDARGEAHRRQRGREQAEDLRKPRVVEDDPIRNSPLTLVVQRPESSEVE
jgi:hypothetical protein